MTDIIKISSLTYNSYPLPQSEPAFREGNSILQDPDNSLGSHIHVILLFLDLSQSSMGQILQLFLRTVLTCLQFHQDARKLFIQWQELNIKPAIPGFTVGRNAVAIIQNGAQPQNQPVVEGLPGRIVEADRLK